MKTEGGYTRRGLMRRKGKQISHDFIHMGSNFKNRHECKNGIVAVEAESNGEVNITSLHGCTCLLI